MKNAVLTVILFLSFFSMIAQHTKVLVWDAGTPNKKSMYWELDANEAKNHKGSILIDTLNGIYWSKAEKLILKSDELLKVKIINANPYKYGYSVDGKLIDFFGDDQTKLLNQFDKIQENIEKGINSNSTTPPTIGGKPANIKNDENQVDKLLNKLDENKEVISNFKRNNDKIKSSDIESTLKRQILIQDSLIKKQTNIINKYKKNERRLLNTIAKRNRDLKLLIIERDSLKKELEKRKKFKELKLKLDNQITVLQQLKTELDSFLIKLKNEDFLNLEGFDVERIGYKNRADNINSELRKILMQFEGELRKGDAEEVDKIINENYKPLLSIVNNEVSILMGLKLFHYGELIEVDGENIDVIQVEIIRTPRGGALSPEIYPYKIWIYGGFKIDVSAGIFFSSLENREFTFATNPIMESTEINQMNPSDDTQDETNTESEGKAIIPKNLGAWEYGFGTLLNLSYRTGTWIKPTFSFGAMLTDDTKFQFLVGGGGIFGKKERIILHGGLALGRVTRLQSGVIADGETLYSFETEGNIPTEEEFHSSFFFGITYNLGKVKSITN